MSDKPASVIAVFTDAHRQALSLSQQQFDQTLNDSLAMGSLSPDNPLLMAWRAELLEIGRTPHLDIWLVTPEGRWLIAPRPRDEWVLEGSPDDLVLFWDRYPGRWSGVSKPSRETTWRSREGGLLTIRAMPSKADATPNLSVVAHTSPVVLGLAIDEAVGTLRTRTALLGLPLAAASLVLASRRERGRNR